MDGTTGKLSITVIEAKITHDTEWFGKMDPFCKVEYRSQSVKTPTHKSGGKFPVWNHEVEFLIIGASGDIWFKLWDEERFENDAVGAVQIKVQTLMNNVDDWFTFTYKGKAAG
jgi:Ca2+-dependent lipid-binding protein